LELVVISPEVNSARSAFFRALFANETGYVCFATRVGKRFEQTFFKYPEQLGNMLEFVNRNYHGQDVYFCPQLLRTQKREKSSVKVATCIWSDLDECDPSNVDPPPSFALRTSPGRYQGFWLLEEPVSPVEGEDGSHRLAHMYKNFGVDQSGWDLTQLLRVPVTYNQKYATAAGSPVIDLDPRYISGTRYPFSVFQEMPQVPGYEWTDEPMPNLDGQDPDALIEKYKDRLDIQVHVLYTKEPINDWSGSLWNLECLLIEAGVPKQDVFVICNSAACNKFKREGLDPSYLWRDVCRADARIGARLQEVTRQQPLPDLLTDKEREIVKGLSDTFVEDYINWAKSRGDAAWQYHEAGAFVILSQLLSGVVKLPTSFGIIVPNLWFMILADTTLTRKSTAMDMAVEMVLQVDPDAVLATDGSLEGLMTGLAARPNRPGIFWRDEFSGLLEMIRKKDYYAGMIESMTKLYDGKYQKRMLRKEVLEIRDPILIFFCGGIRTRVLALMDIEYVYSGFLPRFIFIEAASNIDNYRPIGPMTERQDDTRQKLVQDLSRLREMYTADVIVKIGEQTVTTKRQWEAALDEPTWDRYNAFEQAMLKYGTESGAPEIYTPVMDRLSKSTLKASMLLAACRQEPVGNVKVEMGDLLRAISYCEHWRVHNLDVAANVGKTSNEKQLDQMLTAITREPGVPRSKLMQNYHLTAREADWILETLDQRGTIRRTKNGRSERLYPALIKG
jgi:hypothetical protein